MIRKNGSSIAVPNAERSWRVFVYLVRAWVLSLAVGLVLLAIGRLLWPPALPACGAAAGGVVALLLISALAAGVVHTRCTARSYDAWLRLHAASGIAQLEALLARQAS